MASSMIWRSRSAATPPTSPPRDLSPSPRPTENFNQITTKNVTLGSIVRLNNGDHEMQCTKKGDCMLCRRCPWISKGASLHPAIILKTSAKHGMATIAMLSSSIADNSDKIDFWTVVDPDNEKPSQAQTGSGSIKLETYNFDKSSHVIVGHLYEVPFSMLQQYKKHSKPFETRIDEASYKKLVSWYGLFAGAWTPTQDLLKVDATSPVKDSYPSPPSSPKIPTVKRKATSEINLGAPSTFSFNRAPRKSQKLVASTA